MSATQRLSTELPDAPVWLQADAGRLEQVFGNLLANASRYTDADGDLKVWVHVRKRQVIVRFRDSGVGIAAEALPHIFDLFRQGDEADPRSRAGLGVGLALVRKLVELHGGRCFRQRAREPGREASSRCDYPPKTERTRWAAGQSRQAPLRSCVLLSGCSTVPSVSTTSCAQRGGSIYVEPFKRSTHHRPSR